MTLVCPSEDVSESTSRSRDGVRSVVLTRRKVTSVVQNATVTVRSSWRPETSISHPTRGGTEFGVDGVPEVVESVGASGKKCGGSILATVEGQIPHYLGVAKEHALDCRRFGGNFVRLPQPWLFGVTPFRCRD